MHDLDYLPLYELQILYKQFWKEREEESKMSDEEKGANALGKVLDEELY